MIAIIELHQQRWFAFFIDLLDPCAFGNDVKNGRASRAPGFDFTLDNLTTGTFDRPGFCNGGNKFTAEGLEQKLVVDDVFAAPSTQPVVSESDGDQQKNRGQNQGFDNATLVTHSILNSRRESSVGAKPESMHPCYSSFCHKRSSKSMIQAVRQSGNQDRIHARHWRQVDSFGSESFTERNQVSLGKIIA